MTPYETAAATYLACGFSPIPLPPNEKFPPPDFFTGRNGHLVDPEHLLLWRDGGLYLSGTKGGTQPGHLHKVGNVALRLPHGVLGIDVDAHSGKPGLATITKAQKAWGKLPKTWMSTARGYESQSGIYLFRIPEGLAWPGNFDNHHGEGVDLVRWDHRFIVCEPSIHDSTGKMYRWYTPKGKPSDQVPTVEDFPWLPTEWVDGLTGGVLWQERAAENMNSDEVAEWLGGRNDGKMCRAMSSILDRHNQNVVGAIKGSMHEAMTGGVWALLREAANGHAGIKTALEDLHDVWITSAEYSGRRSARMAENEWTNAVEMAVKKVAAQGEMESVDPCAAKEERKAGGPQKVIVLEDGPDSILKLQEALRYGVIPDTFVRSGTIVRVRRVLAEDDTATLVSQPMGVASLQWELAKHADVRKKTQQGRGDEKEWVDKPYVPSQTLCLAALAADRWEPLPPLSGIVSQPYIRADGTLNQTPGYDSATGIWYEPEREIPVVPQPDSESVATARLWLLDGLLGDFPWKARADLANYLSLLMTPVLRGYIGGLSPLGVVTASAPGSGKSLLALDIPSALFRTSGHAWPRKQEEVHKVITAAFAEDKSVVVFDNVGDKDRLDSPSLAKLLTSKTWSDRKMGANDQILAYQNNRLWLATGNNIALGGDIASRTVLVRLLAKEGDPSKRRGFQLGDLLVWLEKEANADFLMRALLLLALDWIQAGAPRLEVPMRGFSRWAGAMGGFLKHHKVLGFMENEADLRASDEEADEWATFLEDLYARTKDGALTATAIYKEYVGFSANDPTGEVLLPGNSNNPRSFSMALSRHAERPTGGWVLLKEKVLGKQWVYSVVPEKDWAGGKVRT